MRLVGEGRALAAAALIVGLCAGTAACGDGGRGRVAALTAGPACDGKNNLTAEGSTAQERAVALFNQAWGQACPGKSVSYTATGSGAGREQFIAGHVDFAATDSPLVADQIGPAAKRCGGNPAWDLPVVFGPIALVYNLPGVPALVVSSDALAKIFSGRITAWNDPILAALNPGAALPATRIVPVYRSDASGTTDNLQRYLTAAAPQSWANGIGTDFRGGVGEGAATSEGVVAAVRGAPGSIGYVEKGIADRAGVPYARIGTAGGVIPLTDDTAGRAVKAANFVADGNDLLLDLNPTYTTEAPGAYPLVLAGYDIVCSKGYDGDSTGAIKSFLAVVAGHGQAALTSAGYVPLPDNVRDRLVTAIDAIQ
ncbi:phosphate ABC transporter substrate-binding protein PstS [Mycobacterium sp. Marseille-P9652]|uniref:phosphate ABC transporter substrate-binding protein PstS n=1 Tax=Mycobacterium sp. Marseille-P9652 TaxID=2654950 RepID=UPI0012E785CD|nr:phosphate ABC transporter substrate-binding protein PstS [Mycobacterium sp. Marseille-P9652]